MAIHDRWWFWMIVVVVLLLLFAFTSVDKNVDCSKYRPESRFDESYGFYVISCPTGCVIDSCDGLRTACCPE